MTTRRCSKCNRDLPLTEFTKRKDSIDGLRRQCRECGAQSRTRNRRKREAGEPSHDELPARPFVRWIHQRLPYYPSVLDFCFTAGITDREYRRITRVNEYVRLSTVDKVLTNEGSTFLWEIYPELGE